MLNSNAAEEAVNFCVQGAEVYRTAPTQNNKRFLWLDLKNKELRWSSSEFKTTQHKRIALSHIHSLTCLENPPYAGFQAQTRHHLIKFWIPSQKERDSWVLGVTEAMSGSPPPADENQGAPSPEVLRSRALPNLVKQGMARDLFIKKDDLVGFMQKLNMLIDSAEFSMEHAKEVTELPSKLEEFLEKEEELLKKLNNKAQSEPVSEEVLGLQEQCKSLQEKLNTMEAAKVEYDKGSLTIDDLNKQLEEAAGVSDSLSKRIEQLHVDKTRTSRDCKVYKNDLEAYKEKKNKLQVELETLKHKKRPESTNFEELLKGVFGKVKKRNQNFQEKLISVAPEFDKVIMRAPQGYTVYYEEVMFANITCYSWPKNDSEPTLSLHTTEMPICVAMPKHNLSQLTSLIDSFKSSLKENIETKLSKQFKSTCDYLEKQIKCEEKLIRKYKSVLTKSICDLENKFSASQSVYTAELETLSELNSEMIPHLISEESTKYLEERKEMISKLKELNKSLTNV